MVNSCSLGLNNQFVMSYTVLDTVSIRSKNIVTMEALLGALQAIF